MIDPVLSAEPVGKVLMHAITKDGDGTATFNASQSHRYRLSRVWDESLPRCAFVMLNPSTADHATLDNSVRRCVRYARAWGFGSLEVVNLFALRSTDPKELYRAEDPVGAGNDDAILDAARHAKLTVAAWGVHGAHQGRADHVTAMLRDAGIALHALRLTRDGVPGHPLYLSKSITPFVFQG